MGTTTKTANMIDPCARCGCSRKAHDDPNPGEQDFGCQGCTKCVRYVPTTDAALWTIHRAFGVAGGPDAVVLTDEGIARAFSVGAKVQRGAPAEALEALHVLGGEGLLTAWEGARGKRTALGRFDQIAWGHLRSLGYVESVGSDGVRLTDRGRFAVEGGLQERRDLLARCKDAARFVREKAS